MGFELSNEVGEELYAFYDARLTALSTLETALFHQLVGYVGRKPLLRAAGEKKPRLSTLVLVSGKANGVQQRDD